LNLLNFCDQLLYDNYRPLFSAEKFYQFRLAFC